MILSSKLNKRISLKQKVYEDTSIGASDRVSLDEIKKIWGSKENINVDPGYEDDRVVPSSFTQFIFRKDASIDYNTILSHNGKDYKIDHIQEIDDGQGLQVNCTTYGK